MAGIANAAAIARASLPGMKGGEDGMRARREIIDDMVPPTITFEQTEARREAACGAASDTFVRVGWKVREIGQRPDANPATQTH
jgi:hypothetical protein